ncbi:dihydroxyacetone kinase transcriptional activator DhaS [Streptococcus azizii]|uniref:Dihydroxyacetone kinase transcriptional activator DhaS n=1 Tax=Streptococcus azizii TaxID=1579424 RepID=A0AB36JNJ6_9STRE|nr:MULTISPECIES: dihydroxyacetone kinase transcriptional activator DhaS [Streptococcus]MBF0775694.1 dihydroxyacetone kinase transcriptional activator DhaS [Streptococcus sp. 19428wD3_AN2]ONK28608.1 dihydroxyacetone kinase transcriptional activator DhaS [Streptococcus azizii]ONK29303.1 dihydroxyacetone kinase transcriptional activator DhaS [Streptococcus azizii]ONK30293.1 dihydroxyacetone kinase transcriptional activator DhaS [Streptococcus azizii]TFU84240.1 dihydroxyacetone kinase transcriptio
MGTSLITKKRIAKALKRQLAMKSFDKVSVVDIMQEAKMRRQTFYNYFVDKYELLDWIFETELQEQVTDNLNYISGLSMLDELLYYIENNQHFYVQLFETKGQNDFVSYLEGYCRILVDKILTELQREEQVDVGQAYQHFLISYHTGALLSLIEQEMKQRPCQLCAHYPQLVRVLIGTVRERKGT